MSCGISLMYKISGGTDKKFRKCKDCRYLSIDSESAGFGKGKRETYRCTKHPDKDASRYWKPDYPACKKIKEPKPPQQYLVDTNGQLSLVLT